MHGIGTVGWEQEIKLHSQRSPDSREQSKKSVSPNYNIEKGVDNYMALSLTLVAGLVLVGITNGGARISDRSTRSSKTVPIRGYPGLSVLTCDVGDEPRCIRRTSPYGWVRHTGNT